MPIKEELKHKIIDGKIISGLLVEKVSAGIFELTKKDITPTLAVVLIGDDPASQVYVRNKKIMCEKVGIQSVEYKFGEDIKETELLSLIDSLNRDKGINGILVQFPIPPHISKQKTINAISPDKDVDGLHPINAGKLMNNIECLTPCTPQGSMIMINSIAEDTSGMNAVVLGRSNLVGKPMSQLLINANCTVTQVHSKTKDIQSFTSQADILVAAIGIPNFVKSDWVKKDAIIIDVGINRVASDQNATAKTKLVGDVDFEDVFDKVSAITPVPGGVGLMTVACLMNNTLIATKAQHSL
ncbi:MAG: bifunctional methylenetetrahydrofolate dehydrogenase/methenyltetrahydrofolate cyclohydrolase [Rhodobiaceae bacterium]|nr:bifunctional methylenetetrahydrofolate dehydrogenase/methenyltetrahydrofolate cyclohydrolase [Hyphomicrobiales bacterium]MBS70744.1 bifunctional methylenetetrahydrofolate dehydrogenase/methenyltetrahydrofolate cyclohydrolase [Rhodobiaceae bacterium]MEC7090542.1 bifunctional methylenetetrahydrofolate dehydrogenase/methenyltetrahydrofolate cyclohydrolase FolD [Pseudomonadota bacterium]MEC7270185.1 bifunctional methylenetetrahydrofolate dehydrogenase/methenyltetrahydrofolate cyclohydrolase FolD |tara:strand:- start:5674 stop:6567 length:894 start_codon:yes stop_codon:yes gene_type:complete